LPPLSKGGVSQRLTEGSKMSLGTEIKNSINLRLWGGFKMGTLTLLKMTFHDKITVFMKK